MEYQHQTMKGQSKFQVFDDFISPTYQGLINDIIEHPDQKWLYQPNMDNDVDDNTELQYSQFLIEIQGTDSSVHFQLFHSLYGLIGKIVDELLPNYQPTRIRCILQTPTPNAANFYLPHTDGGHEEGYSLIYYPIDATGDTYLFNEMFNSPPQNARTQYHWNPIDSVTPKQGRLVMFPSHQYHAGSSPNSKRRMLINLNFDTKY